MAGFSERLKTLRRRDCLSQSQLARLLGVSSNAVKSWEQGIRTPKKETFSKIAKLFQVSEGYLLGTAEDRYDKETADALNSFVPNNRELRKNLLGLYIDCMSDDSLALLCHYARQLYDSDEENGKLMEKPNE